LKLSKKATCLYNKTSLEVRIGSLAYSGIVNLQLAFSSQGCLLVLFPPPFSKLTTFFPKNDKIKKRIDCQRIPFCVVEAYRLLVLDLGVEGCTMMNHPRWRKERVVECEERNDMSSKRGYYTKGPPCDKVVISPNQLRELRFTIEATGKS